jgi:hypothetical protein
MEESEFDRVADTFRDPRVWRRQGGEWSKDSLWDVASAESAHRGGVPSASTAG